MDITILRNFIDKTQSTTLSSSMQNYVEVKQLYEELKASLAPEWKAKRQKFFDTAKNIPSRRWGEALPDDGMFLHLMYAVLYCGALCQLDPKCCKKTTKTIVGDVAELEQAKKLLNERLELIKKEHCDKKPLKIEVTNNGDIQPDTSRTEKPKRKSQRRSNTSTSQRYF